MLEFSFKLLMRQQLHENSDRDKSLRYCFQYPNGLYETEHLRGIFSFNLTSFLSN